MEKKYIYTIIMLLLFIYIYFAIAGLNGYGIIKVYTDNTEFHVEENVVIYIQNVGITPLSGDPNWQVYRINDKNETLVTRTKLKCCQTVLPLGYFGTEIGAKHKAWVWKPQSTGIYKIVGSITQPPWKATEHIPSNFTIVTIR